MYQKLSYIVLILFLFFSCSKKEKLVETPDGREKSFQIYQEALDAFDEGQYFYASNKFLEAENILPTIEASAKASLMSGYCLYLINFYDESEDGLERFIRKYPANKNISYAYYLLAIVNYEQILDEAKDMINKKCGFIINTGKEITEICWQQFTENECGQTAKQEIQKNIKKYLNEKEYSSEKMYEIIKKHA